MTSAKDIEERAVLWRSRQEQPNWSQDDQAALEAWLTQDTAHRVAWLRVEYGWRKVGRLSVFKGGAEPEVPPARRAWRPVAIAAGLAIAVGLGAALTTHELGGRKVYATELGGHATVPLADGTKIELNTDTKLRTTLADQQRMVWLDRGEAYFEVAKDPSRPFVVYAGDRKVTVLGTKFSVRRDGGRVQVAVAEGRVRVDPIRPAKTIPPAVVTGGDVVIADEVATLVTPKSAARVESELAWRRGLLMFDKSTLGDAAGEINRYNRTKLVVEDPEAAAVRITGSFEAENVGAFARLLRDAFGLNVEQNGDEIRISS